MNKTETLTRWIQRGSQRSAIARALRKPMTTSEICAAARQDNPRIQLRDVWHVMQEMKQRHLVQCPNPRHVTGKLYVLTPLGARIVRQAFAVRIDSDTQSLNWRKYARIARAKTRRLVLIELAHRSARGPVSATTVRKSLRDEHPIGLNPTIRALKELCALGAAKAQPSETLPDHRTYRLTPFGQRLVAQLSR
jgi:hypothetical protein